jgi:phytol kinase
MEMNNQIILTLIFLVAINILLTFNELSYRRLSLNSEITRKFAHFTASLSTLTFPFIFNNHLYVLALAAFFFTVLFFSRNGSQLKSIHNIGRQSFGSYLLPLSIYLTFLISNILDNKFLYILPILILAICDPVAALFGINIKKNNHSIRIFGIDTKKTILGSGYFLAFSFIISLFALYFYQMTFDLKVFWLAIGIALVSTTVELFSLKGTDNLFIPVSVLLMLVIFL